jgi:hypothetical protein
MAANTYILTTVDKERILIHRGRQGRRPSPIKDKTVCLSIDPSALKTIDENARRAGMSRSAWMELAGVLFSI